MSLRWIEQGTAYRFPLHRKAAIARRLDFEHGLFAGDVDDVDLGPPASSLMATTRCTAFSFCGGGASKRMVERTGVAGGEGFLHDRVDHSGRSPREHKPVRLVCLCAPSTCRCAVVDHEDVGVGLKILKAGDPSATMRSTWFEPGVVGGRGR